MAINFSNYSRLEPCPYACNLEAGFMAAIHDPLWFLARQWQMGEHQGENASSPVWVKYTLSSHPIQSADSRFDPKLIPAEAVVESEIDDWWTMGRRIRIGKQLAVRHPALRGKEELCFHNPPPPYEHFEAQLDGMAVWRTRVALNLVNADFGADISPDSTPAWNSEKLLYQQSEENAFATDQHKLIVQRHRGGRMDWYSIDASLFNSTPNTELKSFEAIPTVLHYPNAPNNRWWQIEDADVDLGGYVPDSAHTATAMLTELIYSHSNDWFLFPVSAKTGHVVAMETLEVIDAFGRKYGSQEINSTGKWLWPGLRPPEKWTLFQVDGLKPENLVLWHVAELPLESTPIESVQFGLDEESNLLWAVERMVDSREVESRKLALIDNVQYPKFNDGQPSGDNRLGQAREYAYVPGQGIIPHWHPYTLNSEDKLGPRRLLQRRLVDFSRQKPVLMPAPEAEVLKAPNHAPHQIAPRAIPSNGIEIERRWQLARDMNGAPVLWIQRQRRTLLSPPGRRLRFDVMEEAANFINNLI